MPILFYDGRCGLCAQSVRWVLAHEHGARSLQFARLEGPIAEDALSAYPETGQVDSVIWYEPAVGDRHGRVLLRSEAVLQVWRYAGGIWRLLAVPGSLLPRSWRDGLYDLVARHRHSLGGRDACLLPSPAERTRFLDLPSG